jgi:hypothetical protein
MITALRQISIPDNARIELEAATRVGAVKKIAWKEIPYDIDFIRTRILHT